MRILIRDYDAKLINSERISGFNSNSGGIIIIHQVYHCPEIAAAAQPGNFVLLKVSPVLHTSTDSSGLALNTSPSPVFLRRPLGILDADPDKGNIEIAFRVVGTGTALLANIPSGSGSISISIRGPVGGAFAPAKHKNFRAVAGTMGAIPLLFLRSRLATRTGKGFEKLLLGVPNKSWLDFAEWVRARAPELELYSDDGSLGKKGFVTAGLAGLDAQDLSDLSLACCGPNPMMKALYKNYGTLCDDIQVSLEKRMGCGMGGCFGCVVDTISGRRRVCIDGPVFQAKEIIWDELHL